MILAALRGLTALSRLADAVESLGDIATAELAQQRKDEKDSNVLGLIDAARERRLSKREAERVLRDSGEELPGDGGRDFDG